MKLETLSRRLAEKTGCPELEQAILNGGPLPTQCLIWTGAVQFKDPKPRLRMIRDAQNLPEMAVCVDPPRPVIQYDGRRRTVSTLLYELVMKPEGPVALRRLAACDPLCVHPEHRRVIEQSQTEEPEPEPGFEMPTLDDDWSEDEARELIEILLTEQQPRDWNDVITAPLLEGAPEALIRQVLTDLGKEHLT